MGERMMALPDAMGRSPLPPPFDATAQRWVYSSDSLHLLRSALNWPDTSP